MISFSVHIHSHHLVFLLLTKYWQPFNKLKVHVRGRSWKYKLLRYVRKVWRYQRIIRSHKPKKDRQYNGQVKEDKRTKSDQQIITQKTKDWPTGTPLKTEGKLRCSGRVSSSCSTFDTRRVIVKRHEHHWYGNHVGHQSYERGHPYTPYFGNATACRMLCYSALLTDIRGQHAIH